MYWADDDQWEKVVGDTFGGLRCPECFKREAWALGLQPRLTFLAPPLDAGEAQVGEREGVEERHVRYEDGHPHESHRWVGMGEYGSSPPSGCGECGVDIEDDEACDPCPAAGVEERREPVAWMIWLWTEVEDPDDRSGEVYHIYEKPYYEVATGHVERLRGLCGDPALVELIPLYTHPFASREPVGEREALDTPTEVLAWAEREGVPLEAVEAGARVVASYSREAPQEIMAEDEAEAAGVIRAALPFLRTALQRTTAGEGEGRQAFWYGFRAGVGRDPFGDIGTEEREAWNDYAASGNVDQFVAHRATVLRAALTSHPHDGEGRWVKKAAVSS